MSLSWINEYIGKPWVQNAAGPKQFDCWGLVMHIYKSQLNIDLPTILVDPYTVKGAAKALTKGCKSASQNQLVDEVTLNDIQDFDIVMLKNKNTCYHVGLHFKGSVLHVAHNDKKGVGLARLDNFVQCANSYGVYRCRK